MTSKGKKKKRVDASTAHSELRAPSSALEKQKILIVDDKKENLVSLRRVLESVDADIVEATNGNEALAATLDNHFAVAILDVMMPGMGGYELAQHLRGDEKTKVIPIIFVTASYADEQHVFEGYEAGGVDYIVKPFDPQILLGKIRIFLEIDRSRGELRRHRDHFEALVGEHTYALKERVKELTCLYAVSSLVAACESIDGALRTTVDLIPPGLQYPEIASAKISFEGREFATVGFRETPWKLFADIPIPSSGFRVPNSVLVCYLEKRPELDEGPFFKEERRLVNDIARQIGVMIERNRADEHLRHLTAVLRAVRNVNQLIVHEKDRGTLLRRACEILTETRGYRSAWIGLHRAAGGIQVAAESGIGDAFALLRAELERGEWPKCCRRALDLPGSVLTHDTKTNCVSCPLAHTYRDTASLAGALRHESREYGVLVVALPTAMANDEQEQSLFQELAGDIGFALHAIEGEAARERAEEALRASEAQLSNALQMARAGHWEYDVDRDTFTFNDNFYRIFRTTAAEVGGYEMSSADYARRFCYPEDAAVVADENQMALESSDPNYSRQIEHRILYADGEVGTISVRFFIVKDDHGRTVKTYGVNQDITERKKIEETLRAGLKEREVMLREIYHRVNNNMQIISSLLHLQSRRVKDEKVLDILNASHNRIKSIALIHEKLYKSGDFTRVDFSDFIDKMIIHLFATSRFDASRIRYHVEAMNIQLDVGRAIPCGLIVNELVSNALKHAFPRGREGEILVRMRPSDGAGFELTVKDNGVGLPKGFDLRQVESVGFQIVSDLAQQIDASIEIKSDAGTEIIIRW